MRTIINKRMTILLIICLLAGIANAANWFVKGDSNTNTTGGSSWAAAVTLSKAASSAAEGDVIYLASGTYTQAASVSINKAYTVIGGFSGTEDEASISPSMSNPVANVTKLTQAAGSAFRIFGIGSQTLTGTVKLQGVTFDGLSNSANGQAIECSSSSILNVEIKNCKFINITATATNIAGAININNITANVSIQDCWFERITAGSNGGAITTNTKTGNSITISGCTFKNTSTGTSTAYHGGAIYANGTVGTNDYTLNINNCTFDGAHANGTGGAIYTGFAITINISNSNFINCSTTHPTAGTGHGGAIVFQAPILNISGCKFDGCSDNGRGLIYWNTASTRTTIKKSIFTNNTSGGTTSNSGAVFGIQNASSIVTIDSCYAYNNTSSAHATNQSASVLYAAAGKSNITVRNSAFVGNIGSSNVTRAVIYATAATTGDTLSFTNSIISNNTNLSTNDTIRDITSFSTTYGKVSFNNIISNGEYHAAGHNLSTPATPFKTIYTNLLTSQDMATLTTPTTIDGIVSATRALLNKYITSVSRLSIPTARILAFNGQIFVSNIDAGSRLSAYNGMGQLIHEAKVNGENYNFAAKGIVFVKLSNSNNYQTLKVISK